VTGPGALVLADQGQPAHAIHLVRPADCAALRARLGEAGRAALDAAGFSGQRDRAVFVPEPGDGWSLAVGLGDEPPGRWTLAAAAAHLGEGSYRVDGPLPAVAAHGWMLAQHRFDRYRAAGAEDVRGPRRLLLPAAEVERARSDAAAEAALRDLVDTPAEDMGPDEVEGAVRALAAAHDARVVVVAGDALLDRNFPLIHAVGRASPRRPRLIALDWREYGTRPLVALVGKGVCFDTGGLNLKSGGSMALMKKDMAGAAHAIALARLVMERRLPVRLRLVVAAVDNAVAGNAIRPGDVLRARTGRTIEIGNTDAEGRLILADALAYAAEPAPALLFDFATLTGAARVALGPELPALFTNDDAAADGLAPAGRDAGDPLWRLPLWRPYRTLLRSTIADCNNAGEGGMAGAITAALFMEHFVPDGTAWVHLDIFGWNANARPGRPKGAIATGLFAAINYLEQRFGA
jgi:leucyl aminopeptidase